jgi:hypothetical protein
MSRRLGLILCCCGVALFLVSETCTAFHADHDCCGEGCPVCSLLQDLARGSRQFRYAPAVPAFPPGVVLLAALGARFLVCRGIPVSGVRLKVKMNR